MCSAVLRADSINYAHAGTVAPETAVFASSSNGVDVFYYGSTAGYTDYVGIFDLQTGYNSGLLFDNRTTPVGTEAVVGSASGQINAGDQLLFYIDTPEAIFTSEGRYNPDAVNHAYIASYAGSKLNGVQVPPGLFVGMEDQALGHSDLNYNDEDFVVTNVNSSVTPEPSSFALLGTGVFGFSVMMLRRRASQEDIEKREDLSISKWS